MLKEVDYLIVGQGIAGTLFAHELEKKGHSFIVVDEHSRNASKTAAGMYNPVVLKRFSPVWQGLEQIQQAKKTVVELAEKLSIKLDYPMDILRIFHNEDEKKTWQKKANDALLADFLDKQFIENSHKCLAAPFGLGRVYWGGKIDLNTLLTTFRQYLIEQSCLLNEKLDYARMTVQKDGFSYQSEKMTIQVKKVICCEGYGIKENPFFNELPLKGNKGEVLIVKAANLNLTAAIKSKVFIMPMPEQGDDIYFVGATYNWTDKDTIPTAAAKKELLDKLSQFVDGEITVFDHRAGMRPTVIDRRPLLGRHHKHHSLYILNGLGTRGVMLGATMAKHLYRFIEEDEKLPSSVDISRFEASE